MATSVWKFIWQPPHQRSQFRIIPVRKPRKWRHRHHRVAGRPACKIFVALASKRCTKPFENGLHNSQCKNLKSTCTSGVSRATHINSISKSQRTLSTETTGRKAGWNLSPYARRLPSSNRRRSTSLVAHSLGPLLEKSMNGAGESGCDLWCGYAVCLHTQNVNK